MKLKIERQPGGACRILDAHDGSTIATLRKTEEALIEIQVEQHAETHQDCGEVWGEAFVSEVRKRVR